MRSVLDSHLAARFGKVTLGLLLQPSHRSTSFAQPVIARLDFYANLLFNRIERPLCKIQFLLQILIDFAKAVQLVKQLLVAFNQLLVLGHEGLELFAVDRDTIGHPRTPSASLHTGSNSRYPLSLEDEDASQRASNGKQLRINTLESHGLAHGIPIAGAHAKGSRPTTWKKQVQVQAGKTWNWKRVSTRRGTYPNRCRDRR